MNRISLYLHIITALWILVPGSSLPGQSPTFRHYTTDHGLPSSECFDIVQDDEGYIWIATDNGLSRFNGYEFENFGPEQGLLDNTVFKTYKDFRGRLWFSTMSGDLYRYENDSITPYAHNDIIRQFRGQFEYVKYIHMDTSGTLYAATKGAGLLQIYPNGEWEKKYDQKCGAHILQLKKNALIFNNPCSEAKNERRSSLGKRPLLLAKEGQEKEITQLVLKRPSLGNELLFRLCEEEHLLWSEGALYHISNGAVSWQRAYPETVLAIWQRPDGSLYLGHHYKKGLRQFSGLEALRQGKGREMLNGLSISGICGDRSGKLWISTLDDGIYYLPNEGIQVYALKQSSSGRQVSAVCLKNEDELFVALGNGDVYAYKRGGNRFYQLLKSPYDKQIYCLEYNPLFSRMWKGAFALQFQEEGQEQFLVVRNSTANGGAWPPAYKKIQFTERGSIWACAAGSSGFARINRASGKIEFHSKAYSWGNVRVFAILEDFSQSVWIGKGDGLFQFRQDSLYRPPHLHPALKLRVEEIAQLADSTLVFGAKGGGIVLWKEDHFVQLNTEDGLASNMIKKLHIDSRQRIWVGTPNGLTRISRHQRPGHSITTDSFSITTLSMADGLPSNEINDIDSRGEEVWVATTRGLVKLPIIEAAKSNPPPPIIDALWVNGSATNTDSLPPLHWRQNNLMLKFLAFNYPLNGKINYRYRLQPDHSWTTTDLRSVNYPHLPPGKYRFEIQAQNEMGQWSASAFLPFEIRSPYWQRWWFLLLGALFLAGIGYAYYQNRTTRLKRYAELQRQRAEQAREKIKMEQEMNRLKQAALRAQINPHFIFNCLNSIQNFIMDGKRDEAVHYLSRFARLIRLALNFSLEQRISLEEEVRMLNTYLELEKMRFGSGFDYQVEVKGNLNTFDIMIPPLLIQPYVENAIVHGMAGTTKNGLVRITYEQSNGHLVATVFDNGIGITESMRRKAGAANLHQSVGMTITEKRLELARPEQQKSAVYIEELKGENAEICGTKVTVRIGME